MKELNQYLNYAFEIYDHEGNLIDKIDGPGDIGGWLCTPNSPNEAAIIPIPYKRVDGMLDKDRCFIVIRIPLDEQNKEISDQKEEMFLYEAESEQEAKQIARDLACSYIYWSEWDGNRLIAIISVESDIPWHELPDSVRYYDE